MMSRIRTLVLLAAIAVRGTNAGAEANVNACIYLAQKPAKPLAIDFKAGNNPSDHCLYSRGNDASIVVTDAGLTCKSVGLIEAKSSSSGGDLCATDESIWGLSYSGGKNNTYSGSTLSNWESAGAFLRKGHMELQSQSKDTHVCSEEARCDWNEFWWYKSNTPTIYVSFSGGR